MPQIKIQTISNRRYALALFLCCLVVAGFGFLIFFGRAEATEFTQRSLYVASPEAGQVSDYTFTLGFNTVNPLGSITFEFCDMPLPLDPCVPPAGLDVQSAVLVSQTGETGFSITAQTSNSYILSRTAQIPGAAPAEFIFSTITNPSSENQTTFVRLKTYSSTDGTGLFIDEGAVATSTTPDVEIYTQVPPVLIFCVATTINDADCADMSGNYADVGQLRSTQTASTAVQMQARTNARSGYTIQLSGNSMSSGIHSIPAITTPTPSLVGVGQFGMNLTNNTAPPIGAAPVGAGVNAIVNPNYAIPNSYTYNDGDVLVSSTNPTRNRKFTMSYIVNVPETQPVGVYTTTVTYVCIASF